MKENSPLYVKILIHILAIIETNQKFSLKPTYFLKRSFKDYARKKQNYYQAFYYLLRYKFLERKLIKNVESFEITKKGRYKALKYHLKEKPKKSWDGKWRIVFFDIPQKKFRLRDRLRENLQLLGFKYLQKSIWICPYDTRKELGVIIDYFNLYDHVGFAIIETLEEDEKLKSAFKLK